MKVKIDTKEKFHVITITDPHFTAILAAELSQLVTKFLQEKIRHVVLNFANVVSIEDNAAEQIAALQQSFYENNASLVICGLQPAVEDRLEELGLSETMNITPTESEAWDIVQMEEIERELLDSEDVEFPSHGEKD
jgi:anti-anti-sigma factor